MAEEPSEPEIERFAVLEQLEEWLEGPMILLSFVWLALVLAELIWGTSGVLEVFGTAIWIIFVLEFALRFWLAPHKPGFLKRNMLTVVALVVPAFRAFRLLRVARVARAARGLRLLRVVGTANRGMRALRATMNRRGLAYVLALTAVVVLLGAGGMLALEPEGEAPGGFASYADALWWTTMLITSLGSEYWPQSAEGRFLCVLLALYGFAVFGYITAAFASFFIDQDAGSRSTQLAGSAELALLRQELEALRRDLANRREV